MTSNGHVDDPTTGACGAIAKADLQGGLPMSSNSKFAMLAVGVSFVALAAGESAAQPQSLNFNHVDPAINVHAEVQVGNNASAAVNQSSARNFSSVAQVGNSVTATVGQVGQSFSTIAQFGRQNRSIVAQTGPSAPVDNKDLLGALGGILDSFVASLSGDPLNVNSAAVGQVGAGNAAHVRQGGFFNTNAALNVQIGNGNFSSTRQRGVFNNNLAATGQIGNGGLSFISQN